MIWDSFPFLTKPFPLNKTKCQKNASIASKKGNELNLICVPIQYWIECWCQVNECPQSIEEVLQVCKPTSKRMRQMQCIWKYNKKEKKNWTFFHTNNGNVRITNGSSGIGNNSSNRFNSIYRANQLQTRYMYKKKGRKKE